MNAMLTLAAFTQHTFHGTFDGGSKREEWEETWFSFSLSLNSIEELHHREEEQGRKRDIERTKKSSLVGHNVLYMKRWWRFVWEEEGNDEEKVTHSKDWTKRQLSVGGISQCSSSSYDVLCLLCSLEGVYLVQDKEWLGGKHRQENGNNEDKRSVTSLPSSPSVCKRPLCFSTKTDDDEEDEKGWGQRQLTDDGEATRNVNDRHNFSMDDDEEVTVWSNADLRPNNAHKSMVVLIKALNRRCCLQEKCVCLAPKSAFIWRRKLIRRSCVDTESEWEREKDIEEHEWVGAGAENLWQWTHFFIASWNSI